MAIQFLPLAAVALAGAFVGSQIDDTIETQGGDVNPLDTVRQLPSVSKIMFYSAGAMGLFWLANKSGVVKALK